MMLRMYLYRLKIIIRERRCLFWSALFPICLAFVFNLAFSNLGNADEFETIPIAIVTQNENSILVNTAKEMNVNENTKMFIVKILSKGEAEKEVEKGKIRGYIVDGLQPELYFARTGLDATITKTFVDNYIQKNKMFKEVGERDPGKLSELSQQLVKQNVFTKEIGRSSKKVNNTVIYFYALLAMTCLTGANFGIEEIENIQADKSTRGARVNVAPVHKLKLLASNLLAAYTTQVLCAVGALFFMKYALRVELGERTNLVILTCMVGSLCGVLLGAFLRAVITGNTNTVYTIMNGVVLLLCFLSGLMNPGIKQLVADKVPVFSKVSPAALITDCFYYLYYYDSLKEYWFNILCLFILSAVLLAVVYLKTRRKQYASL